MTGIVEAADWSGDIHAAAEVNGSVYCFDNGWLWANIEQIGTSAKGERYITVLPAIGAASGANILGIEAGNPSELMGVNNRVQLSDVEAVLRRRICEEWMLAGVTITDPATVYIDADAVIGQDTIILPNTMITGRSVIGDECEIGRAR